MSLRSTLAVIGILVPAASAFAIEPIDGDHEGFVHNQIDGVRIDVHADLGNYGGFGVGIRGDIPIVSNGIIEGINDEIAISPGVEVFFVNAYPGAYNGGPYVMPVAMLQWNFYVTDRWSVFPEAGVAMYVGDNDYLPGNSGVYATAATAFGARYHFNNRNALLLRAGWPAGLQVGMTF